METMSGESRGNIKMRNFQRAEEFKGKESCNNLFPKLVSNYVLT
jgi:hypothetical protein